MYESERGLTPEEAEELYKEVYQRLREEVSDFPYNYILCPMDFST